VHIVLRASINEKIYGMIKENSMGRPWDELEDELLLSVFGKDKDVLHQNDVDKVSFHMNRSEDAIRARVKLLRGVVKSNRRVTSESEKEKILIATEQNPTLSGYKIAGLLGMSDRASLVTHYVNKIRRTKDKIWVLLKPEEILEV